MAVTRISAPAFAVVSLAEIKAHVRVLHADDDLVLAQLVAAATNHLEGYTGILGVCLAAQVWDLSFDGFPWGPMKLPLGPVIEVQAVEYTDADGAVQVLVPQGYEVDLTNGDGWVSPVDRWPATGAYLNAVRVRFQAGYATAAEVPAALRVAVMMLAGHWYNNREGQGDVPPAVTALVSPYKRVWLA